MTAACFIGFTGFTLVMPFLPLYFQQLGVTDVGEIALWSGLSLGVTPALTAMLSPFWGRLADRYGRKIMVERSLVSFMLLMGAMAFVQHPWQVLRAPCAQGLFAGYGSLTLTMAADSAPRDRMAYCDWLRADRAAPRAGDRSDRRRRRGANRGPAQRVPRHRGFLRRRGRAGVLHVRRARAPHQ